MKPMMLDSKGREIKAGDLLKVPHFTAARRRQKIYMYKLDDCSRIDWVIAGGESGQNARPSHPNWFRSLRDQCQAATIPFHFKQWGEYGEGSVKVGKRSAGRSLDGMVHDAFPKGG